MKGPAGVVKKANAPTGRKPAGRNVEKFLAREAELHRAKETTRANEMQSYKAQWEESQVRKLPQNGKARMRDEMNEELEMANKEVKILRRERLKQFYDQSYAKWQRELNAQGLSLIKNRD